MTKIKMDKYKVQIFDSRGIEICSEVVLAWSRKEAFFTLVPKVDIPNGYSWDATKVTFGQEDNENRN